MGTQRLNTEAFWQSRADEARAIALHMQDADSRAVMLGIADKFAARAERARWQVKVLRIAHVQAEAARLPH